MNRLGKVRRARLFYMRDLQGKAARIKEREVKVEAKPAAAKAPAAPAEPKSSTVKAAKAAKAKAEAAA